MTQLLDLICPVCREPLPERGNRRVRIPWLGGKQRLVHEACAPRVEAQDALPVDQRRQQ